MYRVFVRAYATSCSPSNYSSPEVIATIGVKRTVLQVEGTSSNNHLPAQIQLGNQILLQRDDFRGLYLHVLTRFSLTTVFSGAFDTFASTLASDQLAEKLLLFDSRYIIVLVSCDAWEQNVTADLVYALQQFGAVLILEVISSTMIRQPYAFVGIRNQGLVAGQSVECLRTNKGMYLYDPRSEVKVPTARARLVLRKNLYRQFYFIEASSEWQYDEVEDYYTGSMRYQINDMREANTTLSAYLGFVVETEHGEVFSSSSVKMTELDYLWTGGPVARFDFNHLLYSPGANVSLLAQTPIINALFNGLECDPPYSDLTNPACSNLNDPPLMLKCGVGIMPYNCFYLNQQQIETVSPGVN